MYGQNQHAALLNSRGVHHNFVLFNTLNVVYSFRK